MSEILQTSDGSSLGTDCTLAYVGESAIKASSMLSTISAELAQSSCSGVVEVVRNTQAFVSFGSQVKGDDTLWQLVAS